MAQALLSERNEETANIGFCQHGDSFLGSLCVAFSQKLGGTGYTFREVYDEQKHVKAELELFIV